MVNELTIITTLVLNKSRKIQLKRFINYHLRLNCQIIIIAPNNIGEIDITIPNVRIIRCPNDYSAFDKLELAMKKVQTPYVSWVADDDFLTMDFAKKALNEMKQDEFIVACDGLTIFKDEGTAKRKNHLYSYKSYLKGSKIKNIRMNRAEILRFQAEYFNQAVIHGLNRTHIFKELFTYMKKLNLPTKWTDNIMVIFLLMHGNIRFIKTVSSIRSHDTRLMVKSPSVNYKAEISKKDIVLSEDLLKELVTYYENLRKGMSPRIKAEIMYFLMKSSKALYPKYVDKSSKSYKIKHFFEVSLSKLELLKLCICNRRLTKDIQLAEKMFKNYSLKF